jgi:hypothetical protein
MRQPIILRSPELTVGAAVERAARLQQNPSETRCGNADICFLNFLPLRHNPSCLAKVFDPGRLGGWNRCRKGHPVMRGVRCRTRVYWIARLLAGTTSRPTGKSVIGCPAPFEKIFWFSEDANQSISFAVPSRKRGARAIVTDAGWDAVDAECAADDRRMRGRRSRVVLMPRCRHQVCKSFASDGDKKADHRGEHV